MPITTAPSNLPDDQQTPADAAFGGLGLPVVAVSACAAAVTVLLVLTVGVAVRRRRRGVGRRGRRGRREPLTDAHGGEMVVFTNDVYHSCDETHQPTRNYGYYSGQTFDSSSEL